MSRSKSMQMALVMALALSQDAYAYDASGWIRGTLEQTRAAVDSCTAEAAALDGTLLRMGDVTLPETGKVIVVNIPSGVVTAYEDGVPVIESKAVVGKATTPTPELNTHVTYVRPNPTWTVPQSIVKRSNWHDKLANNPAFFEENQFQLLSNGEEMSPWEASEDPYKVDTFVQKPGPHNALGSIKIGIENNQAIYLHDTNDPGKFDSEVRAASAGCVRIERVSEIAAWVMDISEQDMQAWVDEGTTRDLQPPETVRVILGYWTAWPDAQGVVRFYPDIYSKDRVCEGAEEYDAQDNTESDPEQSRPAPRFIPQAQSDSEPSPSQLAPVWTESEAR